MFVVIDYFPKYVKTLTHKAVTKKVVADFICNNSICQFGIQESVITNNGANLNRNLMREIFEGLRPHIKIPYHIDHKLMEKLGL